MNRSLYMLLILLTSIPLRGICQEKISSDPEIPIVAWYSIPPVETSLARYRELKETGINISLTFFNDAESMSAALDTALKAGIKLILYCPELKTDPEKTVRRFMNHPAVAGYMLQDEPNTADFPALARWAQRIEKVDNSHFCYLNLFPDYATEEQLGAGSYSDYVGRFVREVPMKFISFDHYPVLGDSLRADWYENLEVVSDAASRAGKPFWAFALSVAHGRYPIATLPQLRLQIFSDLAYGAQAIQYFTYWTPVDTTWNFNNGPITAEGKRSVAYDRIRQVNREVNCLSGVFYGAKVISVSHTGLIPGGTRPLATLPPAVRSLRTVGTGAVVSHLENGSNSYLVIVNRDFKSPLTLYIKCAPYVDRILKDGTRVQASAYQEQTEIDPGDLAVYGWNNGK